jgi:hypothetical protein
MKTEERLTTGPGMQAMAMERPVLATNFSGPTAFLDPARSYPLPWDPLPSRSGAAVSASAASVVCVPRGRVGA